MGQWAREALGLGTIDEEHGPWVGIHNYQAAAQMARSSLAWLFGLLLELVGSAFGFASWIVGGGRGRGRAGTSWGGRRQEEGSIGHKSAGIGCFFCLLPNQHLLCLFVCLFVLVHSCFHLSTNLHPHATLLAPRSYSKDPGVNRNVSPRTSE